MSLNTIPLNASLLTGLYKDVLVETAMETPSEQPVAFLGKNNRHILLIVSAKNDPYLPQNELSFLTNILNACKLHTDDVAVVNQAKLPATYSYTSLSSQFNSQIVLLFDVEPSLIGLPFQFPHFQLQQFDKCTYLYTPSLTEMEKNKALKSKLWGSLKTLFGL